MNESHKDFRALENKPSRPHATSSTEYGNTYHDAYDRGFQEGFDRAHQEQNGTRNTSSSVGGNLSNRNFIYLLYGLFIGGYFTGGLTTVAALILAYVKRADVMGTLYYSHIENIIHTCWMSFFVGLIASFLIFTFIFAIIGWPLVGILLIWSAYRMLKGFMRLSENRAYS